MQETNDRGLRDVLLWLSYACAFVVIFIAVNELRGAIV